MALVLAAEGLKSSRIANWRNGSIPFLLKDGQALHTAFVSLSRLTHTRMKRCWLALAGVGDSSGDLYGFNIKALAETAFAAKSLQEIQKRHTLLPVLAAALSQERSEELFSMMREAPKISMLRSLMAATWRAKRGLSFCVACAREDLGRQGIPFWWLKHQVPFLDVCLTHRVGLSTVCAQCGTVLANGKTTYLPGEACRACGQVPQAGQVDLEPGAGRVLEQLAQLFHDGELSLLRPESWSRLIHGAIDAFGGQAAAIEHVSCEIARRWPQRGRSVCQSSELELPHGFVERQICLRARSSELLGMLVVHEALESIVGRDEMARMRVASPSERANKLEEIERIASRYDLPMGLASLVESTPAFETMREFAQCDLPRINSFVAALPERVRTPISMRSKRDLASCKKLLLRWKSDGGRGRPNTESLAYVVRRLRVEDPEWLDTNLPLRCAAPAIEAKRIRFRAEAHKMFGHREQVGSEELLRNRATAWLYANDRNWLTKNIAVRARNASLKSDRQLLREHRACIRSAIQSAPQLTRTELLKCCQTAYCWLQVNDSAWLDARVPRRQGNTRR